MALTFQEQQALIHNLLSKEERNIQKAVLAAIAGISDAMSLSIVIGLIESGRIDLLMNSLTEITSTNAAFIGNAYVNSYLASGNLGASIVQGVANLNVSFDSTNEFAVRRMRDNRLRIIQEFTRAQAEAARQALERGISQGTNPVTIARDFRSSIGLTARQEQTVNNFRLALEDGDRDALNRSLRDKRFDPTLIRSINSGGTLTPNQIDKQVERYRERWIKFRSEVIARTEALRSVNAGQQDMWGQIVQDGLIDEERIVRKWLTARDSRVRDSHRAVPRLNSKGVGLSDSFITGDGNLLRYPGDINAPAGDTINCRCTVVVRLNPENDNG